MEAQSRASPLSALCHPGPRSASLRPESHPFRNVFPAELVYHDNIGNKVFSRVDDGWCDFKIEYDVSCEATWVKHVAVHII